jgi:hypothetical protein
MKKNYEINQVNPFSPCYKVTDCLKPLGIFTRQPWANNFGVGL